ncbi:MAG: coproporphyrinogen dehydrogenase HemZ [Clostridia bacterium]|nr:coproporphyrinogen dehydrogenase HemZ [Clostridia bacterium]
MNNTERPWGVLDGIRPVKLASKILKTSKSPELAVDSFMREYGATREKAELAVKIASIELPIIDAMNPKGVSLYIGIPFCPTRCLYCSFVSNSGAKSAKLIPEYLNCLKKEIAYTADIIKANESIIESVYIGGGTPTTLSADQLDELFYSLYTEFDLSKVKEFTVEAGRPDTVTKDKLKKIKDYNIDRISINPQTMNDSVLKTIGRNHTPDDIRNAMHLARECGINIINMDIIAGLPGETLDMFKYTVNEVENLNPENTTVHTMSIKRSSKLNETIEEYDLTAGNQVSKMVDYARNTVMSNGKNPYYLYRQKNMLGNLENVGYAKPGTESLYNIYIMEEVQTIISLGCGGVTKTVDRKTDRIERIFNVKEPKDYIERIDEMLQRKDVLRIK